MKLDPSFLELLACPLCRASLRYVAEDEELFCDACAKAYPVRGGIPDLLPESGRKLSDEN